MHFMAFLWEWNKFSLTVANDLMICLAGNDWLLDKADFFFFAFYVNSFFSLFLVGLFQFWS